MQPVLARALRRVLATPAADFHSPFPLQMGWFPSAAEFKRAGAFDGAVDAKTLTSTYTVSVDSADLAVVRDTWEETVHSPDGRSAHRTIKSFEVWQPQANGEWKISRWISVPEPWQREKV